MNPTAIAKGIVYIPLNGKIEDKIPPNNNDNYYEHWHIEMEEYDKDGWFQFLQGTFKTEEEARGYMMGWNSHRSNVSEILFRSRCSRKTKL